MTFAKFSAFMILGTVIGATAPVYAQQSDAASAAPTATAPAAPAAEAPKGPSADTMKKAKNAGYRAKRPNGVLQRNYPHRNAFPRGALPRRKPATDGIG